MKEEGAQQTRSRRRARQSQNATYCGQLQAGGEDGYWGATEQKTRLRIQATSTIESDGLRSGRNRRMATIRDRLGDMTATQRLGSIKYLVTRANLPCLLAVAEQELDGEPKSSVGSPGSDRTYL
jgi:hypothetical protein